MITACFLNLLGAITTILYVKQLTFGLSPLTFVVLTSTVMDTLVSAFTTLPAMVLFAKLIPHNVESSMFALLTSIAFEDLGKKEFADLCMVNRFPHR